MSSRRKLLMNGSVESDGVWCHCGLKSIVTGIALFTKNITCYNTAGKTISRHGMAEAQYTYIHVHRLKLRL